MSALPLVGGGVALVDPEVLHWAAILGWKAIRGRTTRRVVPKHIANYGDARARGSQLARYIVGLTPEDAREVWFINDDGLDLRRANLVVLSPEDYDARLTAVTAKAERAESARVAGLYDLRENGLDIGDVGKPPVTECQCGCGEPIAQTPGRGRPRKYADETHRSKVTSQAYRDRAPDGLSVSRYLPFVLPGVVAAASVHGELVDELGRPTLRPDGAFTAERLKDGGVKDQATRAKRDRAAAWVLEHHGVDELASLPFQDRYRRAPLIPVIGEGGPPIPIAPQKKTRKDTDKENTMDDENNEPRRLEDARPKCGNPECDTRLSVGTRAETCSDKCRSALNRVRRKRGEQIAAWWADRQAAVIAEQAARIAELESEAS